MISEADAISDALNHLHAAQQAHDVEEMLQAFAPDGFLNLESLRSDFEAQIDLAP